MSSEVLRRNGHPIPEVVLRTRRSVMEAAMELKAQRTRRRRHAGIALLAMGTLVLLFAPVLWSAVNDLSTGEHFFDLPVLVLTLSLVLLAAVFAVLLVTWRDRAARAER
jgi:cytochrome bd-type quinol oxidase subunit 2